MGFLGVLFCIILGFYLLGAVLRLALRVWLARKVKEFQEKGFTGGAFTGGFGPGGGFSSFKGFNSQRPSPEQDADNQEGEIKISKPSSDQRKINEKVGEYVDFDEIK